ncbi:hypothetical protein [Rhodoferax sp.]|uniref:hypothetical protein n=1 Tax=Rhodoferax sp. TaxID=50421 RepID=UPI002ACD896A|nr:hypothetical protein [Rhodoferax sp.]MDZ7918512.1 hypothetical protein [Rhodoferax sp.]
MKVTATKPGYFGKLREAGDTFEVSDGEKATWFTPKVEDEGKSSATKPGEKDKKPANNEPLV